ncbi:MAG: hypothetical protein IJR54_06465 [Oscillibacter sp.]|nr:hypothetical protein [Oscillibacter sp.]
MAEFDDKLNRILSNPEAMAQIAQIAQSLNAPDSPPPDSPPPPPPEPDGGAVEQFLPLLRELGGDSNARQLLYALRPYLRPRKQEKVDRALHLARLFRVGKQFLSQWEG